MSVRSGQLVSQPSWKEEVNRRLAEHQSRKGLSVVDEHSSDQDHAGVSDRAARAAARVAARFSKAPSYAEMQAAEARAALRDAEVATRAALEAQAVAQAALAELERIAEDQSEDQIEDQAEIEEQPSEPSVREFFTPIAARQQANQAPRYEETASIETTHAYEQIVEAPESSNHGRESAALVTDEVPQIVAAQPIHANLIHFPRELVATRRIRPRLSGTAELSAEEQLGQLSIFEVDPSSIAIGPTAAVAEEIAPAPSWSGPDWTRFEFDPAHEEAREFDGGPPSVTSQIHLAPLELRCMAALIDFALIVGLTCAAVAGIAGHFAHAPAMKFAEIGGLGTLLLMAFLYHSFFLLATMSTPGMMYAGIALCTFDDEHPTHTQLRGRLGALLISLLPVGLGMAWAIFDEDHLSWHDRISRTYLRRC